MLKYSTLSLRETFKPVPVSPTVWQETMHSRRNNSVFMRARADLNGEHSDILAIFASIPRDKTP